MGRKVHPIGFRLGIIKPWQARWYAEGQEYTEQLHQDFEIRRLIMAEAEKAGVAKVEVERFPGKLKVIVHTAKPGILIGRKGESVKKIRQDLEALTGKKIDLEIKEVKNPDLDAYLVATNIASQIERRVAYRRAMKRAIANLLNEGRFVVGVNASAYRVRRYFQDEQALTFTVDATGAPGTQWPEPRLGAVRPRLEWQVEVA
jgi:small subunit ribosomal protein S3